MFESKIASVGSKDIYWAKSTGESPFESAVYRLIAGVFDAFGTNAWTILRQRIHVSYELSEWEKALIKVCAKRFSVLPGVPFQTFSKEMIPSNQALDLIGPATSRDISDWLAENAQTDPNKPLFEQARPVAAVLLDAKGDVIGFARNDNAVSKYRHAELLILKERWRSGQAIVPEGCTLYVTLKPCRMCAALLLALSERGDFRVVAGRDDSGTHGRHQLLVGKLLFQPKSV